MGYYNAPEISGYKDYGVLVLTDTSPTQTFLEPLELGEVKEFLQVDASHSDYLIEGMIAAAREVAEQMQGRDLVSKQYDLILDRWPDELRLRGNLKTVDLIQWRDSEGVVYPVSPGTGYVVDPMRGVLSPPGGRSWPLPASAYPSGSILVRFTVAALSPIPAAVLQGMKLLIRHWYDNRLPFEVARGTVQEYPLGLTFLLKHGARSMFA